MRATSEARRPRTRPPASTTYQARWISLTLGENVRKGTVFRWRVMRGAGTGGCAQVLGGPVGRRTRIGPRGGAGKPPFPERLSRTAPRPGRGPGPAPDRRGGGGGGGRAEHTKGGGC